VNKIKLAITPVQDVQNLNTLIIKWICRIGE